MQIKLRKIQLLIGLQMVWQSGLTNFELEEKYLRSSVSVFKMGYDEQYCYRQ